MTLREYRPPDISPTLRTSATPSADGFAIRSIRASGLPAVFQYDTGLPFEFDGDPSEVLAQYGQAVLDRINFARGRIYPAFQVNASAGADVYKSDRMNMRFQIDGQNLNNVLNVIDFGGLFSGNAIGPVAQRLPAPDNHFLANAVMERRASPPGHPKIKSRSYAASRAGFFRIHFHALDTMSERSRVAVHPNMLRARVGSAHQNRRIAQPPRSHHQPNRPPSGAFRLTDNFKH